MTYVVLGGSVGFIYGLVHEFAGLSIATDWGALVLLTVATIASSVLLRSRVGMPHYWAMPMAGTASSCAVLGDFAPYAFYVGDRYVGGYVYDLQWEWVLGAKLIFFGLLGLAIGFAASLISLLASLALDIREPGRDLRS